MKRAVHLVDSDAPENMTQHAFFDSVYEAYERAESAVGGAVDYYYLITGFLIRLRFAGEALIPYIAPAFAHLETEPAPDPALTICLWDSASTNTKMPPPPWKIDAYREGGEVHGFFNERIHTVFQLNTNALNILDSSKDLAIYWLAAPNQIPSYESGAPLRTIFHMWMHKRGIQLVHGGAVGIPTGGVLIAGKGGAGKSNTALACLTSELFYAGDDYCLLSADPIPTVFSLYSAAKTYESDISRLPLHASMISNSNRLDSEKALYFLHDHFPEKMLSSFPLRAILVPRVTGKNDTTLEPASPTVGLTTIAPTTIFHIPSIGNEAFKTLVKIVRCVRCYYLNLGTDRAQIPRVIMDLLLNK